MNWQDDPQIQRRMREQSARGKLLRSTVLWSPFFLLCLGAFLYFTFDRAFLGGDHGGTWFLSIVLGVLTLLFGFQAIQSVLDYLGKPTVETGFVTRRWARNDSLVLRTHYMRLGKMILRGDAFILDGIREGDYVEATYYPHSAMLVWVEKREPPASE